MTGTFQYVVSLTQYTIPINLLHGVILHNFTLSFVTSRAATEYGIHLNQS
jgi:hypothetical protein